MLSTAALCIPYVAAFRSSILHHLRLRSLSLQDALQNGNDDLIHQIKKALSSRPDDEPLLFNLGLLLGQKVEESDKASEKSHLIVEALNAFSKAVKINQYRDASWYNIASLKQIGGDNFGAMTAYREAIKISKSPPTLSACYSNLIQLLLEIGNIDEAAIVSNEAVNALPDDDTAWTNMGIVLRDNLSFSWAASCFENAVKFSDGTNAVALNNLGNIYSMNNEVDKAYQAYKQAFEVDPTDGDSAYSLAMILRDSGDFEKSKNMFQQCIEINPLNTAASFQLSALLGNSNVEQCPTDYVADLFDHYAKKGYDTHMIENLKYKVPDYLWEAYLSSSNTTSFLNYSEGAMKDPLTIVELGAGTGLVGSRFRTGFAQLVGAAAVDVVEFTAIDLSQEMIIRAYELMYNVSIISDNTCIDSETSLHETVMQEENVYTDVIIADCSEYLQKRMKRGASSVDLILAGDVLVYIGKLDTLFSGACTALKSSGKFIFSVEKLIEEVSGTNIGFALQESARFAHTKEYIEKIANESGLMITLCVDVPLRYDGGIAINGYIFVLQKMNN